MRMLHVWLIPALGVLVILLAAFYLLVKATGGPGVRTEGRTVHDKPFEDDNPPPPG
jgi:hypothetical protein